MDKKNPLDAISKFSSTLSKFTSSGKKEIDVAPSKDTLIQKKIRSFESERREKIIRTYNEFKNPVTHDIEQDEENIIASYELFLKVLEANESSGEKASLASLKIKSPITKKSDYTQKNKFLFLRIWFIEQKKDAEFIPQIVTDDKKDFLLEFIPKDEWKITAYEKEILQIIS